MPREVVAAPAILDGLYRLLDQIGRGAYGSVYRGVNVESGEFVAVKQMSRNSVETEIHIQTNEIDMLKKLRHPNVVEYYGFIETEDNFYIVMEFCENGSLQSLLRKFGGSFPESLVSVYLRQVLEGLDFLHEQGVVHRDIKGGNILTTKDGVAKLADFGLAMHLSDAADASAGGSPYWMAPEVIEENGLTTASDIWSVGCTTIELLTGKPPYADLGQYPAMFKILQDDHPPIPENVSTACRDFLMQTFQKDPNLRITANQLLRHPWLRIAVKKATSASNVESALGHHHRTNSAASMSSVSHGEKRSESVPLSPLKLATNAVRQELLDDDDWDSAFEGDSPIDEGLPSKRSLPASSKARQSSDMWANRTNPQDINKFVEPDFEEFGDLVTEDIDVWGQQQRLKGRNVETASVAGNFEDVFDDEFDEESKDQLSQRFRLTLQHVLEVLAQDSSSEASLQALLDLASLIRSAPVVRQMVVAEQYVMAMVDAIRSTVELAANSELLAFLYEMLDGEASEQLALMGGLRVLIDLTLAAPSRRSRSLAAASIVKMISLSDSVARMFLACDGLACIRKWLESRYSENRSLMKAATDCLGAILNFKGATSAVRKAILARLVKGGVLDTLSQLLHRICSDRDSDSAKYTQKLLDLLVIFSQGDTATREQMAEAPVFLSLLRELEYLPPLQCVTAAKVIKNVSGINSTLDSLWRLECPPRLVDLLSRSDGPCAKEICNQVLPALFNMCRIDRSRQEAAAMSGIIPVLQHVVKTAGPAKEFAFSILTDLAHAGRRSRDLLWQHDGMDMYIALLSVTGHEVNALEGIVALAGTDVHRAVTVLCRRDTVERFRSGFAKFNGMVIENALTPLLRLLKLVPPFGRKLCGIRFDQILLPHLQNKRAVVRLNILKTFIALHETDRDADVVGRTRSAVKGLCQADPAILVQEMVTKFWR